MAEGVVCGVMMQQRSHAREVRPHLRTYFPCDVTDVGEDAGSKGFNMRANAVSCFDTILTARAAPWPAFCVA